MDPKDAVKVGHSVGRSFNLSRRRLKPGCVRLVTETGLLKIFIAQGWFRKFRALAYKLIGNL